MKRFLSLAVAVVLLFSTTGYAAPEIKAKSAIVASALNDQVLYEKDINRKVYPDGLTKILTALIAFEMKGMDEKVVVPPDIDTYVSPLDSSMGLKAGEEIKVGDLIKGMIVASANDASVVLALSCSETLEGFVDLMNAKAEKLGLKGSHFVNPTGVHDDNQYTTAADMLKIYKMVYSIPELLEILDSSNVTIPATNKSTERVFWTSNHLISRYKETKYIYEHAKGGKTASSSAGGYSVVVDAAKDNMELICIVFDSVLDGDINYALVDATTLLDEIFDNYSLKSIVKQDSLVCESKLKNASGSNHILLYANNSLNGIILNSDDVQEKVTTKVNVPEDISAPVVKDQVLGTVDYLYNNKVIDSVNLIALDNVKVNHLKFIGNSILWFFNLTPVKIILIIVLCAAALYGVMLYNAYKNHKKIKKRRRKSHYYDIDL